MTMTVRRYLSSTGPIGVPKGSVEAKNSGQGSKPWRATSLITLAWPIV